jgi:hypothetical protein
MNKAEKDIYELYDKVRDIAYESGITIFAVAVTTDGLLLMRNGSDQEIIGYMELCKFELLDKAKREHEQAGS